MSSWETVPWVQHDDKQHNQERIYQSFHDDASPDFRINNALTGCALKNTRKNKGIAIKRNPESTPWDGGPDGIFDIWQNINTLSIDKAPIITRPDMINTPTRAQFFLTNKPIETAIIPRAVTARNISISHSWVENGLGFWRVKNRKRRVNRPIDKPVARKKMPERTVKNLIMPHDSFCKHSKKKRRHLLRSTTGGFEAIYLPSTFSQVVFFFKTTMAQ